MPIHLNANDIANNLTQTASGKVLDAQQGKELKNLIDTPIFALDFEQFDIIGTTTTLDGLGNTITIPKYGIKNSYAMYLAGKPSAINISVSGTRNVGQTLTGSYTFSSLKGDTQATSTFKWYRSDNNSGLNRIAISGATSSTYVLQNADLNKFIQFSITPIGVTDGIGVEAFSNFYTQIQAGSNSAPVATNVAFTGTATSGQTLTGTYTYTDSDSDTEGSSIKQWYRSDNTSALNRTAISGATNSTYVLQAGDVGKYIQFSITPVASTGITTGTQIYSSYSSSITAPSGGGGTFAPVVWTSNDGGGTLSEGGTLVQGGGDFKLQSTNVTYNTGTGFAYLVAETREESVCFGFHDAPWFPNYTQFHEGCAYIYSNSLYIGGNGNVGSFDLSTFYLGLKVDLATGVGTVHEVSADFQTWGTSKGTFHPGLPNGVCNLALQTFSAGAFKIYQKGF